MAGARLGRQPEEIWGSEWVGLRLRRSLSGEDRTRAGASARAEAERGNVIRKQFREDRAWEGQCREGQMWGRSKGKAGAREGVVLGRGTGVVGWKSGVMVKGSGAAVVAQGRAWERAGASAEY